MWGFPLSSLVLLLRLPTYMFSYLYCTLLHYEGYEKIIAKLLYLISTHVSCYFLLSLTHSTGYLSIKPSGT
ncbi:hypothetical protein HanIR_Chr09g0407891 [Helianthus annuus]|nr:hypothetical protein HanIR_Chr09g0407891 [Helianthus annuus]